MPVNCGCTTEDGAPFASTVRWNHRDTLLTDPERADRMMLICVSRAARGSDLTLDL